MNYNKVTEEQGGWTYEFTMPNGRDTIVHINEAVARKQGATDAASAFRIWQEMQSGERETQKQRMQRVRKERAEAGVRRLKAL